jgi:hypothetical protein
MGYTMVLSKYHGLSVGQARCVPRDIPPCKRALSNQHAQKQINASHPNCEKLGECTYYASFQRVRFHCLSVIPETGDWTHICDNPGVAVCVCLSVYLAAFTLQGV